jgi:hypothetical protein
MTATMDTYYARHTQELDIDDVTRQRIWADKRIAIHFPRNKDGKLRRKDNRSLDPADYPSRDKGAIRALTNLAKNGGYVCAEYYQQSDCMVGYVRPNSTIELLRGTWGSKSGYDGRKAVLKSLRLKKVKFVTPCDSQVFLIGRPRQGTIMRWRRTGETIENIVKGRRDVAALGLLSFEQQEIMCSEFMRSLAARQLGLPNLVHLLVPVGRTMKGIDICGITGTGSMVLAQVTYSDLEHCREKFDALLRYRDGKRNTLVFFCNGTELKHKDGVRILSLQSVYDSFVATPTGKLWIERAINVRRKH